MLRDAVEIELARSHFDGHVGHVHAAKRGPRALATEGPRVPISCHFGPPRMSTDAYTLPAVHALHLVELVKKWNVAPEELGLGLSEEALADPETRIGVSEL